MIKSASSGAIFTLELTEEAFLNKYNISVDRLKSTGLSFNVLLAIKKDWESKFQIYDDAGANLVRILLRFDGVHSVKYRIKDSEHLIEKLVRKKIATPKLDITLENYQDKIQDLIGIRIMHLFKSDWLGIHNKIVKNFKTTQKPEANIREGDNKKDYQENGCKVKVHKAGYRSVHYIIKTEPTLKTMLAEVQVRTILEEAWSEIDHRIRYPYNLDNGLINQYLQIFNRLAGGADEMGDYVLYLNAEMKAKEQSITELKGEVKKLSTRLEKSSLPPTEKNQIKEEFQAVENTIGAFSMDYDGLRNSLTIVNDYMTTLGQFKKAHPIISVKGRGK